MKYLKLLSFYIGINSLLGLVFAFWSASDVMGLFSIVVFNCIGLIISYYGYIKNKNVDFAIIPFLLLQVFALKGAGHMQVLTTGLSFFYFPMSDITATNSAIQFAWSFCEVSIFETTSVVHYTVGINLVAVAILIVTFLSRFNKKKNSTGSERASIYMGSFS